MKQSVAKAAVDSAKRELATRAKKRPPLEAFDVCNFTHTALRKQCDSKITSAAYNLIHLIDVKPSRFDAWLFYGGLVAEKLRAGMAPVLAVRQAAETLDDMFFARVIRPAREKDERLPDHAQTIMHALYCTFACFSAGDWEGMAAYLGDDS